MGKLLTLSKNSKHISGLDFLRSIAIIAVTLFHIFPDTIKGGYLGVSLFFIITGFLLAYNTQQAYDNGSFNIFSYYLKRIKRIYPSLIIILLSSIGVFYLLAPKTVAAIRPELLSIILGYNNWWQIGQKADYFTKLSEASPFTHMWFMGVELQYYLIWPFIFGFYLLIKNLCTRQLAISLLAIIAIGTAILMPAMYVPGEDVTRIYYGTDTRIYALLFGAVMGLNHNQQPGKPFLSTSILGNRIFYLLLFATLPAFVLLDGQYSITYQGGMLAVTIVFCGMLSLVKSRHYTIGDILDTNLFAWISKKSYGIFLWQYPVIILFKQIGLDELPAYQLMEILLILMLTIWSDMASDCITKIKLPNFGLKLVIPKLLVFLLTTISFLGLMGYGCHASIVSSEKQAYQVELQKQLEKNAKDLEAKNQEAKKQAEYQAKLQAVDMSGISFIGDSVVLLATNEIYKLFPNCYIDAKTSRFVGDGLDVAKQMEQKGQLGRVVVIGLGTNGPLADTPAYKKQTEALLDYLGTDRTIFWINNYCPEKWIVNNNIYLAQKASKQPNLYIINWHGYISKHKDWLIEDNTHPSVEGLPHYAAFVHDRIQKVLLEQQGD